jgi:Fe-S-cluster-containing dehydrogenase component
LIEEGTASGREIVRLTGANPPDRTRYWHQDYGSVRREDVVEKCIFCAHRLAEGKLPACVDACPAEARLFGDLKDPASAPSKALKGRKSFRLKEKAGTKPNVHYIGSYSASRSG